MKYTVIARSAESLLTHDPSQLHFLSGLRNALAVFIALVFGIAIGQPTVGLGVAIGAQVSGFAGLNGTIRKRLQTMIVASLWMGVTTFISGRVGGAWLEIPMIAILGFIAGFMGCVSNEAGLIGMWGTITFILFSWFPHQSLASTIMQALLVVTGGILQAVFMVLQEAVYPSRVEEKSIAEVYRLTAAYMRDPSRKADIQLAGALQTSWSLVQDSEYRTDDDHYLETLLNTAESIRIEVVAVQGMLHTLRSSKALAPAEIASLEHKSSELASFLDELASSLLNARWLGEQDMVQRLNEYCADMSVPAIGGDWQQIEACLIRAAEELLHLTLLPTEAYTPAQRLKANGLLRPTLQLQSAYGALRANFTPQSGNFRHAVRLAAALTAATLLYHILPFSRGYWLPLTTLVVLRPEFATTFSRGVARVLGTLLGALFATFVLLIPDTQHLLGALLVSGLLWGMYTVLNYNLFLFSTILTAEVVVLLSFFANGQALGTIDDRVTFTILGGVVAFAAYFLWPTWLHLSLPDALAKLFAAEQNYVQAVFRLHESASESVSKMQAAIEAKDRTDSGTDNGTGNGTGSDTGSATEDRIGGRPDIGDGNGTGGVTKTRTGSETEMRSRIGKTSQQAFYRKRTRLARTNAVNQFTQALGEPASKGNFDKDAVSCVLTAVHRLSEGLLTLESHFAADGAAFVSDPDVSRFGQYVYRCLEDLELLAKPSGPASRATEESDSRGLKHNVGVLDEVSPYTKQELQDLKVPASLRSTFIRMEDNLGTLFRMLASKR